MPRHSWHIFYGIVVFSSLQKSNAADFRNVSYKPLWKLLIDRGIKKKDLCAMAGISPASCTKMGKGGHMTTEVLMKICMVLDCQIGDVMEFVPENEQ